ncbi:hypothetical protein EZS27_003913 [termite gut metagenome]|uniref:Uncharacterized protein n=1 Tax=termite gut metagenome TaxID=433724 RepID=A0A5J4STU1_9ZZZZ
MQGKLLTEHLSQSELALNKRIPTLGLLSSIFGNENVIIWLKIQFGSVNDYAEQGIGMNDSQLSELSTLVLAEYYYLNAAEICLFIARLKLGKYGQFYGAIGGMKISSALLDYIHERKTDIERAEREQERINREIETDERIKNGITFAQYIELKKQAENGDKNAMEQLKIKH